MRLASVNRGGGDVRWPSAVRSAPVRASPWASSGSRTSASGLAAALDPARPRAAPVASPSPSAPSSYRSTSRPSSYAARKPRKEMTVPDAPKTAGVGPSGSAASAPSRSDAVEPRASAICEATVRFQMSS